VAGVAGETEAPARREGSLMTDGELRGRLVALLGEVEEAAADVSPAAAAALASLTAEQLGNLLAAAGATLARLRTLRALLPREDEPDPSEAPADVP
jgi:hypothetical protein